MLGREKIELLTLWKYDTIILTYSRENYHSHDFERGFPQHLMMKGHILLRTPKELISVDGTAHTCPSSLVFLQPLLSKYLNLELNLLYQYFVTEITKISNTSSARK